MISVNTPLNLYLKNVRKDVADLCEKIPLYDYEFRRLIHHVKSTVFPESKSQVHFSVAIKVFMIAELQSSMFGEGPLDSMSQNIQLSMDDPNVESHKGKGNHHTHEQGISKEGSEMKERKPQIE
ncbi:hypothetical protein MTR_5g040890 [Medicago truncatula]|uniref:Uncharacterized protein n=1 Tax=Medicago truncatula TaxID=3880 RepID=G7KF96_MEDTR|nr:hypothetical protein MTR_5g040890 [Medicago truncatula]